MFRSGTEDFFWRGVIAEGGGVTVWPATFLYWLGFNFDLTDLDRSMYRSRSLFVNRRCPPGVMKGFNSPSLSSL